MEELKTAISLFQAQWLSFSRIAFLACTIIVIAIMLSGCESNEKIIPKDKFMHKKIIINEASVHYVKHGQGKPLILVHGIPTNSFLWRNMIEPLSAENSVYAMDLPGFGSSDPLKEGDYSIASYADILDKFVSTLDIKDASFVCHDLGGPIVLEYILKNPEKYRKLIILNTFLHSDLSDSMTMRLIRRWPIGEIIFSLFGRTIVKSSLTDGVVNKSLISEEIINRYYRPDGRPEKIIKTMLGTLRLDFSQEMSYIENNLSRIKKPTLIIWGEQDLFLPMYLGERIHKDIRHSRMIRLPICGHFVQEDCPELITEKIIEFLK